MSEPDDDAPEIDVNDDAEGAVEVPLDSLSESALTALIESFVLREGTDYGDVERSHERKIADVRRQLERREARIEFDPQTESVNIVRVEGR